MAKKKKTTYCSCSSCLLLSSTSSRLLCISSLIVCLRFSSITSAETGMTVCVSTEKLDGLDCRNSSQTHPLLTYCVKNTDLTFFRYRHRNGSRNFVLDQRRRRRRDGSGHLRFRWRWRQRLINDWHINGYHSHVHAAIRLMELFKCQLWSRRWSCDRLRGRRWI